MPPAGTNAELHEHQTKLANSYQSLLSEFSASELHTVGNYALGRLIGKGSFGKVYLASHKLTNGSKVVLKSAKKDDANLAREIHHHRQFLHPHIARLYEVIVTENLVWLVLEYCPGDELYNHILNHGRMEVGKVQKIFTQLVGAVSYVHAKGCVHRDLKLENILLDKSGNVKLVDFGFTREYKGSTSYLQTWCGTVCYSAPEMLKGEKYAGEKVDVWSLGIILYALLCGELPYDEDDDSDTKNKILKEEPKYPDYLPEPAKDLVKKLLSKRPLLRPSLGDILRDPFLSDHAPQQQEILKLQQPPPFTTQLEKDVLQRMKSAGVNIDNVIENVLSQRCDSLAGWWSLLLEKEQRKERRRDRRRKEREAEVKSIRRLSAASGRMLAHLGEIHEGEENFLELSPRSRGRRLERANGNNVALSPGLPKVPETKSKTPDRDRRTGTSSRQTSSSRSRPPPPPKDNLTVVRQPRASSSRGSQSMLSNVVTNPDLLSPLYIPPTTQRKRPKFYPPAPLKEPLAWVKHFFKEGTLKRMKPPGGGGGQNDDPNGNKSKIAPMPASLNCSSSSRGGGAILLQNGKGSDVRAVRRLSATHNPSTPARRPSSSIKDNNNISSSIPHHRPARPRLNTASSNASSVTSAPSVRNNTNKRSSLSPGKMPTHSSSVAYHHRPRSGLLGRKSTSSSVSSIRSTYLPGGGAGGDVRTTTAHSKTSSMSSSASASLASPSAASASTTSRLPRSPHASSVKLLPTAASGNTTGHHHIPNGLRFSRSRAPPADIRISSSLVAGPGMATPPPPGFPFHQTAMGGGGMGLPPVSPGLPVFARRKRHVFKGPSASGAALLLGGSGGSGTSPGAYGGATGKRSRSASTGKGRNSIELSGMPGVMEEEEDEEEVDDGDFEDVEEGEEESEEVESPPAGKEEFGAEALCEALEKVGVGDGKDGDGGEIHGDGGGGGGSGGGGGNRNSALTTSDEKTEEVVGGGVGGGGGVPLTAEALKKMEEESEKVESIKEEEEKEEKDGSMRQTQSEREG